jgi:structure-specific recognition protein 1
LFPKGDKVVQFDGFRTPDYESLNKFISGVYGLTFPKQTLSTNGWHWGEVQLEENDVQFMVGDKKVFQFPAANVTQATQLKDDVQLFFSPAEDASGITPALVEMRFMFPEGGNLKGEEREGQARADPVTDAKFFKEFCGDGDGASELKMAEIARIKCALPRGRFDLELYPKFARLVASSVSYRIPYANVSRMYHLPSPKGAASVSFILSMEPPIRRGQTVYNHIIIELAKDDHITLDLQLTDEQLNEYQGQLNREMKGKPSSLVARLFKVLTGKKVTIPGGSFKSSSDSSCVPCSVSASTGHLYLLERSMFFIDKPALNIPYDHIEQIEFQRHSDLGTGRNFDLEVKLKSNKNVMISGRPKTSVAFSHIAREERGAFVQMFRQKNITLKGLQQERQNFKELDSDDDEEDAGARKRARNVPGEEDDSENDSSFGSEGSSSSDALEYNEVASSDSDSDADEGASKKAKTGDDDDDDE